MRRKKGYKAPEGLVKQRKSKNWYIKTRGGGRLIYKSTRTSDLRRAELILAKVKVALLSLDSQVREITGKSIPFGQLMSRYVREVSASKRSSESDIIRSKPLLEYFKDQRIDTITIQDIYRYQDWRRNTATPRTGKPISGATVNREIALLRHALRKAMRWGYLEQNPAVGIEGFSESKRERYITDEEFEAIKRVAKSHDFSRHLADIMDVLYHTAQRSGRILSLKWKQINFKERTITFEQVSKTRRVPHVIWINDPLFALLSRMRRVRRSLVPWVFHKQDATPYKSINKGWNTACKKAGVKDARIHDIRHKTITDMVRAGFSLEFVGRVAGHSTPSTTHRYAHLSVDATKEALDSLGKNMAK